MKGFQCRVLQRLGLMCKVQFWGARTEAIGVTGVDEVPPEECGASVARGKGFGERLRGEASGRGT